MSVRACWRGLEQPRVPQATIAVVTTIAVIARIGGITAIAARTTVTTIQDGFKQHHDDAFEEVLDLFDGIPSAVRRLAIVVATGRIVAVTARIIVALAIAGRAAVLALAIIALVVIAVVIGRLNAQPNLNT